MIAPVMEKKLVKNNPVLHDLITTRSKYWVCKCGASGSTLKTMKEHEQVIKDDTDFQNALDKADLNTAYDQD